MTALLVWFLAPSVAWARQLPFAAASIQGKVADEYGDPLSGALVSIRSPNGSVEDYFAVTDRLGSFSVPGLRAGEYLVRITKAAFRPEVVSSLELLPGASQVVTVTLQTAIDIVNRGVRRGSLEDRKWALRSSQSTRPVLRHNDDAATETGLGGVGLTPVEPSGYFQVYSSSMEAANGPSESMGSQFAVTLPVGWGGRVRLEGQYTESPTQPRGVGATYEFSPGSRLRSSFGVNVREGAYFNGTELGALEREIAVEYVQQAQWRDDLVLHYGAAMGRNEGYSESNYLRPEIGASWLLWTDTTFHATFSGRSPITGSDPVRGSEFFDRSVFIPPDLERFSHLEAGVSQVLDEGMRVSAGAFRDEMDTQAFLVDTPEGRQVAIVDTAGMSTSGVRVVFDRVFRDFEASLGYTYASGFGLDSETASPGDFRESASRQAFHVVTARVNSTIDLTQTHLTAVYRWAAGGYSLAPVDPYQVFAEYNDPTLSLTVAQDLPTSGFLPARLQAVLDARNIFENSFGPQRTVHASYPRILKGGIHFTF